MIKLGKNFILETDGAKAWIKMNKKTIFLKSYTTLYAMQPSPHEKY